MSEPTFDHYAKRYQEELDAGLAVSGESSDYFADLRLACLAQRLEQRGVSASRILDFGCGVGSTTGSFLRHFQPKQIMGIDPSHASIEIAKTNQSGFTTNKICQIDYRSLDEHTPEQNFDLVYCNGVFHHIDPELRKKAMTTIYQSLRSGGVFAFWENNPYSLPARYVMSRISFDADAVMVWPSAARRLMASVGFKVLLTDYRFIFPGSIRWMRWSESFFCKLPVGAQYLILSVK